MKASSEGRVAGTIAFRVLGIPTAITPYFWMVTLLVAYGRELLLCLEWAAVVLVSVLVHELGHALVARRFGRDVRIELHGMGGTTFHQGAPLSHGRSILISLAGPGAGVLLGVAVFLADRLLLTGPRSGLVDRVIADALWANWGYGLLNLLPILPLDGGHITQELVDAATKRKGHPAGAVISLLAAAGLLVLSLVFKVGYGLFLLGWLLISQAQRSWMLVQRWRDRGLAEDFARLEAAFERRDGRALVAGAEELLPRAVSLEARARALHLLACGYFFDARYAEAYDVVRRTPAPFRPDPLLLGVSSLESGRPRQAVEALRELWRSRPNEDVARWYVLALTADHQLDEALAFVRQAPPQHLSAQTLNVAAAALFHARRFDDALHVCERSFERYRSAAAAYNAACSLARKGEVPKALEWLARAVDAGYDAPALMQQDPDLEPLREEPAFRALLERMGAPRAPSRS